MNTHAPAAEPIQYAIALHRQGRLHEAAVLYQAILHTEPRHFDALHLLGVVVLQLGDAPQACALLRQALAVNVGHAAAHSNLGLALQALGRQAEALACYDEALRLQPDYAEALYNRGNALLELGRTEAALPSFNRAVAIKPDYAEAWHNQGKALHNLRRHAEALASYSQALRLRPDDAEIWFSRGNLLLILGRWQDAMADYDAALRLNPEHAAAFNNRGLALQQLGRLADALASYDETLRRQPGHIDALINRGTVLRGLQRPEDALASYDAALRLEPDNADALNNRGNAWQDLKRPEQALADYSQATQLKPDLAEAHNNRGNALLELQRLPEALARYDDALRIKPDYADAFNNRGNVLLNLKRPHDALASYNQALRLKPDYVEALNNRGSAWQELGDMDAALADFAQAIQLKPDCAAAHWNEGLARLMVGDYRRGWQNYEWRWAVDGFPSPQRDFKPALWLGAKSLQGKTILLHAEQGLGDTIQFCRYAQLAAVGGARVLLEVQPPLQTLLAALDGVSHVYAQGETLPDFDCHCPLMSLPLAFGTQLDSIPAQTAYLHADPERVRIWQGRLAESRLPKIGLVWSGGTLHKHDHHRSIPLAEFSRWVSGNAQFVSLQKDLRAADQPVLEQRPDIAHFGDALADFADTAGLIAHLDLVIAVDTSVAHLAAAMGKPVWLLLAYAADWRWLRGRDDSPWYPTMRLFRQTDHGDWASALAAVAQALAEFLGDEPAAADADALFRQAFDWHRQGWRAEAETVYREALRLNPQHFDALHLLGVLTLETGDSPRGIALLRLALAVDPNQAAVHANLGIALRRLGQPEEALTCHEQALRLQAHDAHSHNNRGLALQDLGRLQEALAAFAEALRHQPNFPEALCNQASTLQSLNRLEDALASYQLALQIRPDDADILNLCGNLLREMRRSPEALACYERALRIQPDSVETLNNRGNALLDLRRPPEALVCYENALRIQPDNASVWNNQGTALFSLKRALNALASYERAIQLKPDYAEAYYNSGSALQDLQRHRDAVEAYGHALRIKPDYAEACNNRGLALQRLLRFDEALASYALAQQLKADYAQAQLNEGLLRLALGDFAQGWKKHEWRWQAESYALKKREFAAPIWLGEESLQGKTILLHAEQGFGDTLQFCRYVSQVAARAGRVLLEVQPPLKTLLAQLDGVSEIFACGEPLPSFDCHCPLLSLPLAFGTRLDTVPADSVYLSAEPSRIERWRAKLGGQAQPRIGLVWSGNSAHSNDPQRSLPLADLEPLLSAPAQFVSLQKDLRPADGIVLERNPQMAHFGGDLLDFAETAALVANLDWVIAVDTAVAHLAGAMGKPVWLLLPFHADWRWLLDRNDSPWYPSARLFRQPASGDWDSVVAEVRQAFL